MNAPRRRRRHVEAVSDVDAQLIERGLPPSWAQHDGSAARVAAESRKVVERQQTRNSLGATFDSGGSVEGNDARLIEEVPPHWHARL